MAGRCYFEMECARREIRLMSEMINQGIGVKINNVSKDFLVDNEKINVLDDIDESIYLGDRVVVFSSRPGRIKKW